MATNHEELVKTAQGMIAWGQDLAMQKVAEVDAKDKEEDEEEKEGDLDEEGKKEAAAAGAFAAQGFIHKLAQAGQERFGDADYYFRALALEHGAYEKVAAASEMYRQAVGALARYRNAATVGGGAAGALGGAAIGAAAGGPDNRLSGAAIGAAGGAALGAGAGYGASHGAAALRRAGAVSERARRVRAQGNAAAREAAQFDT